MKYDNDGCKDEDSQLINNANIYMMIFLINNLLFKK